MLSLSLASTSTLPEAVDYSLLSAYRRERLHSIKNRDKYRQSLGAELLLIKALKALGGAEPPLDIRPGPGGKPRLEEGPCFSLSHSGEMLLCALSDRAVGADVQRLTPYRPELARRFFTAKECAWLDGQKRPGEAFSLLWSLKESYAKMLGRGIAGTHFASFSVDVESGGRAFVPGSGAGLRYGFIEGYVLSLCSDGGEPPFEPEIISLADA